MTLNDYLKNKDILVTGGCGSIGSKVVEELIKYPVKRIRVYDNNETAQFYLQEKFKHTGKTRALLGDIRDKHRLDIAMEGVDYVIHAAALKHVGMCEYNPSEAVKTNVVGTQNVIDVARKNKVKKFLAISTDKAVSPINTMGATKLLSEKITLNANLGITPTKYSCVRFGNVLNSSGSVIPIFYDQIKKGGPVLITSNAMTRFFMTLDEAVLLILESLLQMEGREIFILKMKSLKIADLAEVMIDVLAPKFGYKPSEIKIKLIGIRPGEKISEALMYPHEVNFSQEHKNMFIVKETYTPPHKEEDNILSKESSVSILDSSTAKPINKKEIKSLITSLFIK